MDLECLARRCLDPFPVYVADVLLQERRVFELERVTHQLQRSLQSDGLRLLYHPTFGAIVEARRQDAPQATGRVLCWN